MCLSLRSHKASGRAYVVLNGKAVYCGRYGMTGSQSSALASLNVSGCTSLRYWYFTDTQLTEVDLFDLPALESVQISGSLLASATIAGTTPAAASISLSGCALPLTVENAPVSLPL